jgi:hypothetical protein
MPAHRAIHALWFKRQWLAGVSSGQDAAAGPQNVAGWARHTIAKRNVRHYPKTKRPALPQNETSGITPKRNVRHYPKTKRSMLRAFALEEYDRMKTEFEQLYAQRGEGSHSAFNDGPPRP